MVSSGPSSSAAPPTEKSAARSAYALAVAGERAQANDNARSYEAPKRVANGGGAPDLSSFEEF